MIYLNNEMFLLLMANAKKKPKLNAKLQKIVINGFIEYDGSFLLKYLYQPHIQLSDFPDRTGYEAFINSIHIDDYVISKQNHFKQSLLFINRIYDKWQEITKSDMKLIFSISKTDFGYNIKFYTKRDNEIYIDNCNLDAFSEPIMMGIISPLVASFRR
jgi:hypothetical protein